MKRNYHSPEMEIEKFTVPTSVYTTSIDSPPVDPDNPDTEF